MGWFNRDKEIVLKFDEEDIPVINEVIKEDIPKHNPNNFFVPSSSVFATTYDGEKTPNELGIPKSYIPDFQRLATRSWQAYHESDQLYLLVNRLKEWVVGTGIEVVSEPKEVLLNALGIKTEPIELQQFSNTVESLFSVIKSNKHSTKNMIFSLDQASSLAYLTALLTGDVLCVYRYTDSREHCQFIDGRNIVNPTDSEELERIKKAGHTLSHGVEFDKNKKQFAFHVLVEDNKNGSSFSWCKYKTQRIDAYGSKTGRVLAKLIFGSDNYTIDSVRGMPLLSVILETGNQITRYRDSALAKAEEISNTALTTVHQSYSTGEDPHEEEVLKGAEQFNIEVAQETAGYGGYAIPQNEARKIAMTTKRKVYNMPVGAEMKTLEAAGQLEFKDFFEANFSSISAALSIPPEVARLAFNSNYTAAQLAASFFRHIIEVKRKWFAEQAYIPFIDLVLEIADINGELKIPYYRECKNKSWYALSALCNFKYFGDPIPKADPLKEAKASRSLLGEMANGIPLTSLERESRANNIGDWENNISKYAKNIDTVKNLGIKYEEEKETIGVINE